MTTDAYRGGAVRLIAIAVIALLASSCRSGSDRPGDADSGVDSDAGTDSGPDADAPIDAGEGDADAEEVDADAESRDGGPEGCDLYVELATPAPSARLEVPIPAASEPMICWAVPSGAVLPGADGWDLDVRRDGAGGTPEDAEWTIIRGVPAEERSIRYGECPPGAMGCWPAKTLRAGGHSIVIWDGTRVGGLAGALSFDVE
jgi:hypothetical protein